MTTLTKPDADIFVTREKALADYLALGASRSLAKLIQYYADAGLKPPALSTLKAWSSAGGWSAQAADYDRNVREATQQALAQKQANQLAQEAFSADEAILQTFKMLLVKVSGAISNLEVNSIRDAERCLRMAKDIIELDRSYRGSIFQHRFEDHARPDGSHCRTAERMLKDLAAARSTHMLRPE